MANVTVLVTLFVIVALLAVGGFFLLRPHHTNDTTLTDNSGNPVEPFEFSMCESEWPKFDATFERPVTITHAMYDRPNDYIEKCTHSTASANTACSGKSYLDKIKSLFDNKTSIAGKGQSFTELVGEDPCPNIYKTITLRGWYPLKQ